ncbi:hypothetical protein FO519_004792 [Halicephalobus sp. NKZ332]|nr:hypothetical protein FO519_004792 [Halicephalobus sp. NKZ332]
MTLYILSSDVQVSPARLELGETVMDQSTSNSRINMASLKREIPVYKLTYFVSRGHAEVSRLILHYKKIPFDDIRINIDEYSYYKNSLKPHEPLPILEFQGEKLSEPVAIARFLARRHGLSGANEWEEAKTDALMDLRMKFGQVIQTYIALSVHAPPDFDLGVFTQKNFQESFMPGIEKYGPQFEELLQQSKNGWFISSGITFVDFSIAELTDTIDNFYNLYKQRFPLLAEHSRKVHQLPEIQEYLRSRPHSKY